MKKIMQPEDVVIPQVESEIINHILDSQKKFISFLESKVKNREVAEDIFQTSVLKVLKKSKDLKDEEALIPWFYQILRNSVIDYFRENQKVLEKSEEIKDFISELENEASINKASKDMLCECFKDLIKTLNPAYADILSKVDLGDSDLQIVADEEQTTLNNLTVKLHRARKALRKSLEATCGACTKHGCLNCTCGM